MFNLAGTAIRSLPLVAPFEYEKGQPLRKSKRKQIDNGTFVLPLKAKFCKRCPHHAGHHADAVPHCRLGRHTHTGRD